MPVASAPSIFSISLDGQWDLNDLHTLPYAFGKTYAFSYCFEASNSSPRLDRVQSAIREYPWWGGYSYVHTYNLLERAVPPIHRPTVHRIAYASPGFLDLLAHLDTAVQVAQSLGVLLGTAAAAAKTYAYINKTLANLKPDRQEAKLRSVRLTIEEQRVVMELYREMAVALGFESLEKLNEVTGDPLLSLKLLMAHYRRMIPLLELAEQQKIVLPTRLP